MLHLIITAMKTIEEVAFDRFDSDQKLPERKRIGVICYADWARFGAREAQRWIPIEEELPPESGWDNSPYIVKTKHEMRVVGYTCRRFHLQGGLCLNELAVTHLRPLERL